MTSYQDTALGGGEERLTEGPGRPQGWPDRPGLMRYTVGALP